MPVDDLALAYNTLRVKADRYTKLWSYYDGDQPLVYSTERLKAAFARINVHFVQNWMSVVIDAAADKINLMRFVVNEDDSATKELNNIFSDTELDIDDYVIHLAMLVCGESYVIAWPDEETGKPEAYYNDPRMCHLFYEADKPRAKRFGCKQWIDDEGRLRLTLYYPDRLEYYVSNRAAKNVQSAKALMPLDEEPTADNPYNLIPIFHFRRERRKITSELDKVLSLQDAINKFLSDMMVVGEYGAFPQRYVISMADPGQLENAPNKIWWLPSGDGEGQATQAGQFNPAELSNYLKTISDLANSIGIITKTPKHYFFGQSGDPSGEALIAMEAPLNSKCNSYIERVTPVWRELAAFLMILAKDPVASERDISPIFDRPETVQPYTNSLIRKTNVESGIPLTTILRDEGWTDEELERMKEDKEEEAQASRQSLAEGVLNALRQTDGGQQSNGMEQPAGPIATESQTNV